MGTLKTIQELETETDVSGGRGNTGEHLQNLIESLASVYGLMNLNQPSPGTLLMTGSWQNITLWTNSRDTRGVQDDLVAGHYTVKAGGGGRWELMGRLKFSVDTAGIYRLRPRAVVGGAQKNVIGQDEELNALVGSVVDLKAVGIPAAVDELGAGDTMALQIRGPTDATVTALSGFFRVKRI